MTQREAMEVLAALERMAEVLRSHIQWKALRGLYTRAVAVMRKETNQ